ncbi:MAG: bifunctional oligoribonuclease/PAP phosphatase NrnA [Christensenellaceae bacterium]|jgi:phosphoesterase RecJ-like protein|nr:bifunctional oligoribonuclease/PAP phosphatase NrnA [Christensenellaceae bacterium]
MTEVELQKKINKIKDIVSGATTFAVVGHTHPDGDCIGCCVAVAEILTNAGKTVSVFADGRISEKFSYLPTTKQFNAAEPADHYDVLFIVDLNETSRLGKWEFLTERADKIIVLDHHIKPTIKPTVLISMPERASTGEIVFNCIELLGNKKLLTKTVAEALYTSITCDTGCFLFANTTKYTHYVAERLMEFDIDIETINFKNFREYNRRFIPIVAYVLNTMKFEFGGRLAISVLPFAKVQKWGLTHDERHSFFKYTTDGNGVVASIFITELKKGEFNISLRSLGDINVSSIARTFGGGGHKNASGATMVGKKKTILKQLLAEFAKVIK